MILPCQNSIYAFQKDVGQRGGVKHGSANINKLENLLIED